MWKLTRRPGGNARFAGELPGGRRLRPMELVVLCLLGWPWTPGAAPSRGLGSAGNSQTTQVRDPLGPAWSGAEGGARPGAPTSASDVSLHSGAGDQPDWDFTLVLIAISGAALVLISYCCFHWKCHLWLLSCLHPAWQGWMGNRRRLPRVLFINSLQHYGSYASRTPRGHAAEGSWSTRVIPPALHSERLVHFRRASGGVPKDGSASLPAAAPGTGTSCGPTLETILEMEDQL